MIRVYRRVSFYKTLFGIESSNYTLHFSYVFPSPGYDPCGTRLFSVTDRQTYHSSSKPIVYRRVPETAWEDARLSCCSYNVDSTGKRRKNTEFEYLSLLFYFEFAKVG